MHTGILIVASGSAGAGARAELERFGHRVKRRFPVAELRWSYTAAAVRHRLAEQGQFVEAPDEALRQMVEDGVSQIAVASLHVIAGREFHDVARAVAEAGAAGSEAGVISLGKPLLASYDDLDRVADAVLAALPPERVNKEAAILIGHGSAEHPAALAYTAAAHVLAERDPLVFVGTVTGRPSLADVIKRCRTSSVKRAYLLPFTTAAGSTVNRALNPSAPSGWTRGLAEAGIEAVPVLRGLVENEGVSAVWLDHLAEAVRSLDRP
jgi:sirohydrochlorin cobaltochelatase